jgi:fatty acid desaturase
MACKFWLEDFSCLFKQVSFIPDASQNEGERLNSMTWVVIIVALILLGFGIKSWWVFLILGLLLTIVLYFGYKPRLKQASHYTCSYRNQTIFPTTKKPKLNLRSR